MIQTRHVHLALVRALAVASVLLVTIWIGACGTNPDTDLGGGVGSDPENEVAGAIDALQITHELYEFADAVVRVADTTAERPRILACTNNNRITLDTVSATRSLTINFNGRQCTDGKFRQGQLILNWTGNWTLSSRGTINFRTANYLVNGNNHRVRGTITVVTAAATPTYNVVATDTVLYQNVLGISTFATNTNRVWTNGVPPTGGNLTDYTAVRFAISGSGSGNSTRPLPYIYNVGTTTPLLTLPACAFFVTGRIDVTPQGRSLRTLDFGTGNCDNQATLIADGITRNVSF
jgi:hypothetical protein